ncbi:hypothetical protein OROGR_013647 [Orobanche gracilis]
MATEFQKLSCEVARGGETRVIRRFQLYGCMNPVEELRAYQADVATVLRNGKAEDILQHCLAVKLANQGHPTIVVSTDPAHSLSSFDQNLAGGVLVPVQGVDSPLYALEKQKL